MPSYFCSMLKVTGKQPTIAHYVTVRGPCKWKLADAKRAYDSKLLRFCGEKDNHYWLRTSRSGFESLRNYHLFTRRSSGDSSSCSLSGSGGLSDEDKLSGCASNKKFGKLTSQGAGTASKTDCSGNRVGFDSSTFRHENTMSTWSLKCI